MYDFKFKVPLTLNSKLKVPLVYSQAFFFIKYLQVVVFGDLYSVVYLSQGEEGSEYFRTLSDSFMSLLVLLTTANNPDGEFWCYSPFLPPMLCTSCFYKDCWSWKVSVFIWGTVYSKVKPVYKDHPSDLRNVDFIDKRFYMDIHAGLLYFIVFNLFKVSSVKVWQPLTEAL